MSAQSFRVDSLSISPQMAGAREVSADPKTGELLLADPVAGVWRLADLTGLQKLPGIITAGPGGQYSSVNDALSAAVDAWDSRTGLPAMVAIVPGVVREPIRVPQQAWVSISAIGEVLLRAGPENPAVLVQGGTRPTRADLYGLDMGCDGGAPTLDLQGGIGGAILGVRDCRIRSQDIHAAALRVEGLTQLAVRRSELYAPPRSVALQVSGNADVSISSSLLSGGFSVSTIGKWLLEHSTVDGSSLGEFGPSKAAVFWGNRMVGEYLLGGPIELTGCELDSLAVEKGARMDARRSLLRKVEPNADAALEVDRTHGVADFVNADTARVDFPVPRIRPDYQVSLTLLERPAGDEVPWLSKWDRHGFEVAFFSAQTLRVMWAVASH